MGNQLAAGNAVNLSDVSSTLTQLGTLGGEGRNFLSTLYCMERSESEDTNGASGGIAKDPPLPPPTGDTVVVKVFVKSPGDVAQQGLVDHIRDVMQGIQVHIREVDATLPPQSALNVLTYRSVTAQPQEQFCMLQRSHVAHSLQERLAARPLWSAEERLFACYQLLCSLVQLHDTYGMVHGDIKANNVLLHSSGWLYLADQAPFKPARLPANNPALFDFYYDTDDSRICCLAPEKFVSGDHETTTPQKPSVDADGIRFDANNLNVYGHTPAMDVFSAACVMAHIVTEEPLFRLSELLEMRQQISYAAREDMVRQKLQDRGAPDAMTSLLLRILCTPPEDRPSAREVLEAFTPSVFPRWYQTLQESVLPVLLTCPIHLQAPLLDAGWDDVLSQCLGHVEETETGAVAEHLAKLLLPILMQGIRSANSDEASCRGVACAHRIAGRCQSLDPLLELVLPHLLAVINTVRGGRANTTRILAIRTICGIAAQSVARLHYYVTSGCSHSSETISPAVLTAVLESLVLPCLEDLLRDSDDEDEGVLAEVAAQLPSMLLHARYCLEQRQYLQSRNVTSTAGTSSYGQQLQALLSTGWHMLQALYRQECVSVVSTIMSQSLKVAAFLGEARSQEDLIPLFTTAVASSLHVRRYVYPEAILVHAAMQRPHFQTAHFFVDEGLRQQDSACLRNTLRALLVLVKARRFPAWDAITLVHQVLPLTGSSTRDVRLAACRVVELAAHMYSSGEVLAYLECAVRSLVTHPVPLVSLGASPLTAIRSSSCTESGTQQLTAASQAAQHTTDDFFLDAPQTQSPRDSFSSYAELAGEAGELLSHCAQRASKKSTEGNLSASTSAAWRMTYHPTPREAGRVLSQDDDKPPVAMAVKHSTVTPGRPSSMRLMNSVYCPADVGRHVRPVAVPTDAHVGHIGAVQVLHDLGGGRLLTAGSRGEAKVWRFTSGAMLQTASHLPVTLSSMESYTTCAPVVLEAQRRSGTNHVALGATDGGLYLVDVDANKVTSIYRTPQHAAITASALQSSHVLLCSSAAGDIEVVDVRDPASTTPRACWRATVAPCDGAPSSILPLHQDAGGAHALLACTYDGVVNLFDLRFQLRVARYEIAAENDLQRLSRRRQGILCGCHAPAVNGERKGPSVLLGTASGVVHRLQLLQGGADMQALQQPSPPQRCPTRSVLFLPHQEGVITGDEAGVIRQWSVRQPTTASPRCEAIDNSYRVHDVPHHGDAVLCLGVIEEPLQGTPHLVSGGRDGSLTVWAQQSI